MQASATSRLAAWLIHLCTFSVVGAWIQNPNRGGFVTGMFAVASAAVHIAHLKHEGSGSGFFTREQPFSIPWLRRFCHDREIRSSSTVSSDGASTKVKPSVAKSQS